MTTDTHANTYRKGYNATWGGEDPDWNPDEYKNQKQKITVHKEKEFASAGDTCPKCRKGELGIRTGPHGLFLACDERPKCEYTCSME
jgi:ssDNA-binding Zn-finger/Zn-ribbon topoisomerase 1